MSDASARPHSIPNDASRMHTVTPETTAIVDMVLDYARRRLLDTDVPLDKPMKIGRAHV